MGDRFKVTVVQTAMMMTVLTLISKGIGFIREMVLAGFFGTGYVVDAYVMASNILTTLFGGVIVAISTAYMPLFSQTIEQDGVEGGNKFTNEIINLLLIITVGISIIGIFFSDEIVTIFAQNFTGEKEALASFYVKVIFSYIIFYAIAGILEAYLQYKGIFLPQIISGYFISICMIIAIVISAYISSYYLAFGMLSGYAIRCIIIWYIAKKNGFRYRRSLEAKKNTKDLFKLALPVFIGSYITYINLFVDKTLASGLPDGGIAALNYASLLNNMIISVTITILSTLIYPKLTQANAAGEVERFNSMVKSGINIIIILGVPCSLGAVLYSNQAIQIVYERGAFDQASTAITTSAFMYYAAGMLFFAANDFIIKVYYSIKDMKTPMIFGGISVIINITLSLILIRFMGLGGLALATSIAGACNTVMLIKGLKKSKENVQILESSGKIIKICVSAVIAVGLSYVVYKLILIYMSHIIYMRILQLGIAVCIAIMAYLVCLGISKIEELKLILAVFKRKK